MAADWLVGLIGRGVLLDQRIGFETAALSKVRSIGPGNSIDAMEYPAGSKYTSGSGVSGQFIKMLG
jgi:hypothetical protein